MIRKKNQQIKQKGQQKRNKEKANKKNLRPYFRTFKCRMMKWNISSL